MKREGERDFAALAFGFHRGVELIEKADPAFAAETHHVARLEPARGLDQGAPARAVEPLDQVCRYARLVLAAADAAAVQERRNDLGVVDHHGVAGAQQLRQIADCAVLKLRQSRRARTTRSRAASRGDAGRNAMRSSGSAKSNRSVRMVSVEAARFRLPPPVASQVGSPAGMERYEASILANAGRCPLPWDVRLRLSVLGRSRVRRRLCRCPGRQS